MAEAYAGLVGAFVYAARQSRSWLFRLYVVTGAVVGLFIAILLVLAAITWLANPVAFGERLLLGVIGILLLAPLAAPVLVVARRHRRGGSDPAGDRWLGLAGFAFVAAIVLALFISDPSSHQVGGPAASIAAWLDGLPDLAGLLPPVVAAVAIVVVARLTRPRVE
jgi:hypothetical protein